MNPENDFKLAVAERPRHTTEDRRKCEDKLWKQCLVEVVSHGSNKILIDTIISKPGQMELGKGVDEVIKSELGTYLASHEVPSFSERSSNSTIFACSRGPTFLNVFVT